MPPPSGIGPEQAAREAIDRLLSEGGWTVQSRDEINLNAARGVAIREFKLAEGYGYADYLLFVDEKAVGVLEAKPQGHTLGGVEPQVQRYASGLPPGLDAPVRPLPFLYLGTGSDTRFINLLDPDPRTRRLVQNHIHRPETIAEWLSATSLPQWAAEWVAAEPLPGGGAYGAKPSSLRARLRAMPAVHVPGLWRNKVEAITNVEKSLRDDRPRALIQMATGSGKTLLAIASIYRLIKYGGARRVLFLVDRKNLGEQAETEFESYRTPDDNRQFTELYNVQRLTSNTISAAAKVVITTIQRLYSMLRGDPDLDPGLEEGSQFDTGGLLLAQPLPITYNPTIPIEFFDVIWVDECHRSIYSLWRQVLEYFDAYLIGLTATPSQQTFGFFNRNLVMDYSHEQAVADGVNVEFEVYRIRTRITQQGATIEAGPETVVGIRDRQTRRVRWERPDEDVTYNPDDLDRAVVARDQIRLVIRTFRDRLQDVFPGRKEVPKTLIFAKDDSHAEDILQIVREEFGRGNEFAQKITYKVTGQKPKDLIQEFRISFNPRIAVTVDMIATGTDIKPIEIVMFMRAVKSRIYFEQMKGRGVRVIDPDELRAVTPDAPAKTHFVIVDCVGVCEQDLSDTQPLERQPSVPFKTLLEQTALGNTHPDVLSSLASRLARLDRQCGLKERDLIAQATGGTPLADITRAIVQALDPDRHLTEARTRFSLSEDQEPSEAQVKQAAAALGREAVQVLATHPEARTLLIEIKRTFEQIIDEISVDTLDEAGFSEAAKAKARGVVESFERFLAEHRDEIDALQFFYSQPYQARLRYRDIKALAAAIEAPPRQWTPERLWRAYETLDTSKVKGASAKRLLVDLVSLIRFALHQRDNLVPYAQTVRERFERWLAGQRTRGRGFADEQVQWLEMMAEHIGQSLEMEMDDFSLTPFAEQGGLGRATQVFGSELRQVMQELNEELAA